jgi:hypothetical protein
MFYAKTLAVAALFAGSNAHMRMKSPAPFPSQSQSIASQNGAVNGPLLEDGSNFPCKYTGPETYSGGPVNTYAKGATATLETIGSAVHGGGSCQISITYDTQPTKDSVWKVIHSIEGGCPARNQAGNLPANADFENPDTYQFTIPEDIPSGQGVIAWTWFNRIGNREFYMNCGSVEITGDGGDQASYDALPDMLVLNIAGHGLTTEGNDFIFANAGNSVEDNIGPYGEVTIGTGGASDSGSGSGSGSGSPPASSVVAAPSATFSAPGGVYIEQPSATATPTVAPIPSVTANPIASDIPIPSSAYSAPAAAPTGGAGGSGACSPEGVFDCINGSSFRQCASGQWSVPMQLAAGTSCSPGQTTGLSIAAVESKVKRTARALRV